MKNKKTKVLLLGLLPSGNPKSTGGASILFENIVRFMQQHNEIEINIYNLRKNWKSKAQLIDYFIFFIRSPFLLRKYDVLSFHVPYDFLFSFGWIFLWINHLFLKKRIIFHSIGGFIHQKIKKLPAWYRKLIILSLKKTTYYFVETKEGVAIFKSLGIDNVRWLPNSRPPIPLKKKPIFNSRYIFISRVEKMKGIDLLCDLFHAFSGFHLDIYGPLIDYKKKDFENLNNIDYKGNINAKEVTGILTQYSALLLPTKYETEGYPGAIIEAFSVGLPVMVSNTGRISEIVENNLNGFLLPKNDKEAWKKTIENFNPDTFKKLSEGARKSFIKFDMNRNFQKFLAAYEGKTIYD